MPGHGLSACWKFCFLVSKPFRPSVRRTSFPFPRPIYSLFFRLSFSKGLASSGVGKSKWLGVAPVIPFKSRKFSSFDVDGKAAIH